MTQQLFDNILCVFPIFAPSESQLKRNLASVKSLVEFLKVRPDYLTGERGAKLQIVFGGYAYKNEYWDTIQEVISSGITSAKCFRFDKNYGKARVVNKLVATFLKNKASNQYIFTTDSDMIFLPNQQNTFERLLVMGQIVQKEQQKPFGFISLNQQEENCHWRNKFDRVHQYKIKNELFEHNEMFSWPSNASGIAGGALFISCSAWEKIKGYRTFNAQYSGDDAYLILDTAQAGFSFAMSDSIAMIHPVTEGDAEYVEWKKEQIKTAFEVKNDERYKSFLLKDAEFWDKQNGEKDVTEKQNLVHEEQAEGNRST